MCLPACLPACSLSHLQAAHVGFGEAKVVHSWLIQVSGKAVEHASEPEQGMGKGRGRASGGREIIGERKTVGKEWGNDPP